MAIPPIGPGTAEKAVAIRIRDGKEIYNSEKLSFGADDKQPMNFCVSCGGKTVPIIYVCKDCGKRFIQQFEAETGKTLIIVLDETKENGNL